MSSFRISKTHEGSFHISTMPVDVPFIQLSFIDKWKGPFSVVHRYFRNLPQAGSERTKSARQLCQRSRRRLHCLKTLSSCTMLLHNFLRFHLEKGSRQLKRKKKQDIYHTLTNAHILYKNILHVMMKKSKLRQSCRTIVQSVFNMCRL